MRIIEATITAVVGTVFMGAAMENYLPRIGSMNVIARIMLLISGLLLVYPSFVTSAVGGAVAVVTILTYVISRRILSSVAKRQAIE